MVKKGSDSVTSVSRHTTQFQQFTGNEVSEQAISIFLLH